MSYRTRVEHTVRAFARRGLHEFGNREGRLFQLPLTEQIQTAILRIREEGEAVLHRDGRAQHRLWNEAQGECEE